MGDPVATEILQGRWPLVIGLAVILLRLSALVLRGVSFLLVEIEASLK